MNGPDLVWVGLAGGAGAVARFLLDATATPRVTSRLPVATMAINVTGSLLLGVLTGLVVFHHVTTTLTVVAGTGFCGGYTTFSTASVETVRMVQRGEHRLAAVSVGITVAGTLAAAAAGLALASL